MALATVDLLIGKLVSILEVQVSLLGGVHDQLDEIKSELVMMKAFLEDAERRGAQSEVEKVWVAKVRAVSNDVQDIIDEFTYQINKQRSWGPFTKTFRRTIHFPKNLWERHRMATKLLNIISTIKAIPERNQRYAVSSVQGVTSANDPGRMKTYGESSLFFKDDDLVGIRDTKEQLVGLLLSRQAQRTVISVVGMGGSGKTTLVANTFNSQAVKQHFNCYAWVTVSRTYRVEDLFGDMIKELFRAAKEDIPQDLSSMSYKHLVEMLVNYLQSKRYVIVLDDVWDVDLWREINVALPNGALGSRVMLTTRKEDIASLPFGVGSHVHHVQPLKKSEAWDLFCMKAFSSCPNRCCPPELELIARDLVVRCEGLPLGIVALGSLMSTKNLVSEWRRVYDSLNWELRNNPKLEVVKSILLLSFNDLPYRLKNCFLYCCIFPEDYVIQCKRLIRLWSAEGFVEQVRGAKPEDIAESYIAELTCRCMLLVVKEESGRAKAIKMHDLLRELALSISEVEKFCTVYNDQEPTEEGSAHRLSVRANCGEIKIQRGMSKVRTLFIFSSTMATFSLNTLPSGFRLLTVLDLKGIPIVRLPHELVKCFNLKYLNLKRTEVEELPKDIGRLHNLETLDIRHSKIRLLPTSIVKLEKLRYLLMYHHNFSVNSRVFDVWNGTQASLNICKLKGLQVLVGVEGRSDLIINLQFMTQLTRIGLTNVREADGKDLCNSIESMKLIEELTVKSSNEDEMLCLDALSSAPPLLKRLLLGGILVKVPLWFHSLHSLKSLSMHWSRLTEDFLPYIQALPNLTELYLSYAYTGQQLLFRNGFQKLTKLTLHNVPELTGIIIEEGAMPAVKELLIWECAKLKQLPHGIEHLTCLQELSLQAVPNELVERIRGDRSVDHMKVKHILKIDHYYKSEFGWSCESLSSCPPY